MVEQSLTGGNTTDGIVRVGQSVRRPTGPWTRGVHALLAHLGEHGFGGAPRVHGIDERGREILDYRIGGTHYSAPLYWALQICVGLKSCP